MVIGRIWEPYVTYDNRQDQTLAGVKEKDTTHAYVTAKERRLKEDHTQSRWSTMKAWSTTPGLGRDSSEHILSIQEYSWKIVSGPLSGLVLLALRMWAFGVKSWGIWCSELHLRWVFVCFRWQETINITLNASCVWAVGWWLRIRIPMP